MGPLAILAGMAAVGAIAGGVRAHNQDEPVWKGIGQGALLGGGLGLGAVGMGAGGGFGALGMGGAGPTGAGGAAGLMSKLGGLLGRGAAPASGAGPLSMLGGANAMNMAPNAGGGMTLPGGAPAPTGDPGLDAILKQTPTFPGGGGSSGDASGGMGDFWGSLKDFLSGVGAESKREEEIERELAVINAGRQQQAYTTGFTPGAVAGLPQPLAAIGSLPVGQRMLGGGLNF